jgi:uncharacterized protein YjbK
MSQHIEIEFKNLITEEEFNRLITHLKFHSENFRKQVNHYFDTYEFRLKDQGCALRVRKKSTYYELTLKQPAPTGLLETNQTISETQANAILKTGMIPEGPVQEALSTLLPNLDTLHYFGSLTTNRAEKEYEGGLIVLDHSVYLSTEDYEIEYELTDEKSGYEVFKNLLEQMNIPFRKTDNKIMRFYKQKEIDLHS